VKDFLKNLKLNENTISNVLTVLVFVLVGVLIYNYFRSVNQVNREQTSSTTTEMEEQQKAQMTVPEVVSQGLPAEYTVKQGDSLWKISQQAYGTGYEWQKVYEANKAVVSDPNLLEIGTKITLPDLGVEKTEHTVIKGDNLWNISQSICGDGFLYSRIAVDNNLANPRIIIPGQKLTIVCKL
jgi:nucleoid-associated protein YgaU